jgi:hypothetical protein
MKPMKRGLAFALALDDEDTEYLVGLYTHDVPNVGSLVWIAEPTFPVPPSVHDVAEIDDWRWPITFPLAAAIRRRLVIEIGEIPIPIRLARFPTLRGGDRVIGWVSFTREDGEERTLGPTQDWSLPVDMLVNIPSLRKLVRTNWRPEQVR